MCVYVCLPRVYSDSRDQKRDLNSQELELQIVMTSCVGAGNRSRVLWKSMQYHPPPPPLPHPQLSLLPSAKFKKKKKFASQLGLVLHAHNPKTQQVWAGRSEVAGPLLSVV